MAFTALLICVFVLLCQAEGDVREETLYVKTGTDLLLDVLKPVNLREHESMFWKFQSDVNVVEISHTNESVLFGIYNGRAELFPQNQSLLLKNVRKTDSGEYRARVDGFTTRDLVKYQVTVLDPVSDVKLEVKQCSSDWSELTLTCRTLDGLLNNTFICDETTCSHEGGEKNIPPGASMKVYLKDGSVTCHHRNNVSSTEDTRRIALLCWIKKDKDPVESAFKYDASKTDNISITSLFFILIILLALCVAAVYYRQRRKKRDVKEETLYVETGADLLLDVEEPVTLHGNDEMCWEFQREVRIVKFTHENPQPDYAGRAELEFQKTWLLLKNVQKTDSGEYSAGVLGSTNKDVVKYQVIVLDEIEGEEDPGHVDFEDSEEDPFQGPGPRNDAQGDVREETLYVETGTDLHLNIGKPLKKEDKMCWKFQKKVNIVKFHCENEPVLHSDYRGRAELDPQNKSVVLKNVQKTDSGKYKAVFSGDKSRVVVKYQVIVQDPVSDMKPEVKV